MAPPTTTEHPDTVNLENCAEEPIHIIGHSQSHGVLLACDPLAMTILQAGENTAEFFNLPVEELLDKPLSYLLGDEQVRYLAEQEGAKNENLPLEITLNGRKFLLLFHFSGPHLLLDFEPLGEVQDSFFFQKHLTEILNRFQAANSVEELSKEAVVLLRKMFGYDRVMVYRFDEEWNGEVIAEDKNEEMETWLGLRYPATDIPRQARNIFLKHGVRIISNVDYTPVPIKPEFSPLTGEPLDISQSGLRAVSPIHIEYLKNMGVGASLTAAIVIKGKLWGLLACHHNSKKHLDFYRRESCRFLAQTFSAEIRLRETNSLLSQSEKTESIRRQLMAQMKYHSNVFSALNGDTVKFTDLIECEGGAVFYIDRWELTGKTPSIEQMSSLLSFVEKQPKSIFLTHNLSAHFPQAGVYKEKVSGLLSLRISDKKYIFWFRPEVVQEVSWGGNPRDKAFYNEKEQRLSPRKSFEKWSEKLTGFSQPWQELDYSTARIFRESISHVLLERQRKEIEALNTKLVEANRELELFSYGLSHDLRAPIRGLEGFINILKEDHEESLGEEGNHMLEMSQGLIERMNSLIDDILEYSRLGHSDKLQLDEIDTEKLIQEILESFNVKGSYPKARIIIQEDLPVTRGDRRMLFQVWSNLLNNALKYSSEKEIPKIAVGSKVINGRETFFIKDNGIGIKSEFTQKIFETFQRAVGSRFKGSGIGLAIVKRIVEKHQGEIWVESEAGEGSVFYFYLEPLKEKSE